MIVSENLELVYTFPGQGGGTIQPGMFTPLEKFAAVQKRIQVSAEILGMTKGQLLELCSSEDAELLRKNAQKLSVIMNFIYLDVLLELDAITPPAAVAGHSIGKLSALVVAGVLTYEEALLLAQLREDLTHLIKAEKRGSMYVVGRKENPIDIKALKEVCSGHDGVALGCVNALNQMVLSGPSDSVLIAAEDAKKKGVIERFLDILAQAGFHSDCVESVVGPLGAAVNSMVFTDPKIPFIDDTVGQQLATGKEIQAIFPSAIFKQVNWLWAIDCISAFGELREVGPGQALTSAYDRDIYEGGQEGGLLQRIFTKRNMVAAITILGALGISFGTGMLTHRRNRNR